MYKSRQQSTVDGEHHFYQELTEQAFKLGTFVDLMIDVLRSRARVGFLVCQSYQYVTLGHHFPFLI